MDPVFGTSKKTRRKLGFGVRFLAQFWGPLFCKKNTRQRLRNVHGEEAEKYDFRRLQCGPGGDRNAGRGGSTWHWAKDACPTRLALQVVASCYQTVNEKSNGCGALPGRNRFKALAIKNSIRNGVTVVPC